MTVGFAEAASRARNLQADVGRWRRWAPARMALWRLLERRVSAGASVAVVGAGNGDDLPLRQVARRAGRVDLLDIDAGAVRVARRRLVAGRRRVRAVNCDVTDGSADRAVAAAITARPRPHALAVVDGLADGPYDVVVADLLYTQLLFPALLDAGLTGDSLAAAMGASGPELTRLVVGRLHASAPEGIVVHLHDLLGWWPGHRQPFAIQELLALGERDLPAALTLAASGQAPLGADPRPALDEIGAELLDTALWRWPFAAAVDYLVVATVARLPT